MVAIKGYFDGQVFVPDEPVDLPRNQSVILHVEPTNATLSKKDQSGDDFLNMLGTLVGSVEAPRDWSAEHDHYLYGTPKRGDKEAT
jgi:hypothetical protein